MTAPNSPIEVSAGNPCPFLRALVASDCIDDHVESLAHVSELVVVAGAVPPKAARRVRSATYLIGLIGNGLSPLRLIRTWRRGMAPDRLRGGPLDKRGVGSRILDQRGRIDRSQLARLAQFSVELTAPDGTVDRGLGASQLTAMMDANFTRAEGARRRLDRKLMEGEWPVLLKIMGRETADSQLYLSVDEVSQLFTDRRLPARIIERLERT